MQIEIGWVITFSILIAIVAYYQGKICGHEEGFEDGLDNHKKMKDFEDQGGDSDPIEPG